MEEKYLFVVEKKSQNYSMYVFVSWERRKNKLFVCFLRKVKKEFYVLKTKKEYLPVL
jgi:hypothetical protein